MPIPRDSHAADQRPPLGTARDPVRSHDAGSDRRDRAPGWSFADRSAQDWPGLDWQAHVTAGRIGTLSQITPAHRINLEATERALGIARPRGGAVW